MAIYEIVLEGRQGGQDMLSVVHYDVTGAQPPDWQALADVFRAHMVDHLEPFLVTNASYIGITVRLDVEGSVGLFVPFTLGDLVGSDSDDGQIAQAAMLVNKNTGTLTRPTRGRVFQGGISSQYVSATGIWTSVARDAVDAFWTDVREIAFAGPGNAAMVVKATNPTAPNTEPYNYVATITTAAGPVVQRRRKINSGS